MDQDFWLNLPAKDVAKSKEFFLKLGFKPVERDFGPHMASFYIGRKAIVFNLFKEEVFHSFSANPVTDTRASTEILFSLGANSPEEVDALAKKAEESGGKVYGQPGYKDGWMYGCGFIDLDGHRWNVLYMDLEKMPK